MNGHHRCCLGRGDDCLVTPENIEAKKGLKDISKYVDMREDLVLTVGGINPAKKGNDWILIKVSSTRMAEEALQR